MPDLYSCSSRVMSGLALMVAVIALSLIFLECGQAERAQSHQPGVVRVDTAQPEQPNKQGTVQTDSAMRRQPPDADSLLLRVVSGYNRFGLDLLRDLAGGAPTDNTFISPISAAVALSMVYNGAQGPTAQEMARSLGIDAYSVAEVNQVNGKVGALLNPTDSLLQLSSANSVWIAEWLKFKPDYLDRMKTHYSAQFEEVDFSDPSLAGRMNGWVSEQTHGRIPNMVTSLDASLVLYLLNAVYFKGTWVHKFEGRATQDRPFTLLSGGTKQVPLMKQGGTWQYFEADGVQAIKLPYQDEQTLAGDGRFQMYVFLPGAKANFAEFVKGLTYEVWQEWIGNFRSREGTIMLPRFTLQYSSKLNEPLQRLGMKMAFDPGRADFSGMATAAEAGGNLVLSEVQQKRFLRVDEEGTEAAAATGAGIVVTSVQEKPTPFTMIVDHPFVCAIVDEVTTSILFIGAVTEPK